MHILYVHGFGSSPASTKARAFAQAADAAGHQLIRVDARVPSLARLRLSAIIDHLADEVTRTGATAVIGSSLGGLAAARLAERDPRVRALVLMAPAFQFAARWQARLGPVAWAAWQATGWLEITDYATGQPAQVDFGFAEDAMQLDGDGYPTVTVPCQVFHGRRDDIVDIHRAREFAARTPSATLQELDDGHELTTSLPVIVPAALAFVARYGA